jgi:hypothetical protein
MRNRDLVSDGFLALIATGLVLLCLTNTDENRKSANLFIFSPFASPDCGPEKVYGASPIDGRRIEIRFPLAQR